VIISQDITDALAKKVQDRLEESRSAFVQTTQQLLQKSPGPHALAEKFNAELRAAWNLAEVGFAVDLRGMIYSPKPDQGTVARTFRDENDRFLSNRENVPVFSQSQQLVSSNSPATSTSALNGAMVPSQAPATAQQQAQSSNQSCKCRKSSGRWYRRRISSPNRARFPTACLRNLTFGGSLVRKPAARLPVFWKTSCA